MSIGEFESLDELVKELDNLKTPLDNLETGQSNLSTLQGGQDTVATPGTAEQLNGGTSLSVADNFGVRVKALDANAGKVYVGGSGVSSSGYELKSGEGVYLYVSDVSNIYIDAANSGDGVCWLVEQS